MNTAFVGGFASVAVGKVSGTSARCVRPVVSVPRSRTVRALRMADDGFEISEGVSFDSNPVVIFLALAGWIVPSSIPFNIPLTGGKGLTPAFLASIQDNLSRWPKGPQVDDPFWTLFFVFHLGMFATLIFGTIGYNINKASK